MAKFRRLELPELIEICPVRHTDGRGYVSETWSGPVLAGLGIDTAFVQDNHSYSAAAGVLRGLHYQEPPFAQQKLVRVVRGSVFDVAVDVRQGSPNFGKWVGLTLSAQEWNQVLVPVGFAHGFLTLEPDCEVLYKTSAVYSPAHERAVRYDDPDIAIDWPTLAVPFTMSDKDGAAPSLRDARPAFHFQQPE